DGPEGKSTDSAETGPGAEPTASPEIPSRDLSVLGPSVQMRRSIHRQLLEHLDLASLDRSAMDPEVLRPKVIAALRRILAEGDSESGGRMLPETLVADLADEALGLG